MREWGEAAALRSEKVKRYLEGGEPKKMFMVNMGRESVVVKGEEMVQMYYS